MSYVSAPWGTLYRYLAQLCLILAAILEPCPQCLHPASFHSIMSGVKNNVGRGINIALIDGMSRVATAGSAWWDA